MAPSAFVAAAPSVSAPSTRTARCSVTSPYPPDPKTAKTTLPAHLAARAAERARIIADDAAAKKVAWEAELAALRDPPVHAAPAESYPSYSSRWQTIAEAPTSYASRVAIEAFVENGTPVTPTAVPPAEINGVASVKPLSQDPPSSPPAVEPVAVATPPTPTPVSEAKVGTKSASKVSELTSETSPSASMDTQVPLATPTKSVSAPLPSKVKPTPLKSSEGATQIGSPAQQATQTKSASPSPTPVETKKNAPLTPSSETVTNGTQALSQDSVSGTAKSTAATKKSRTVESATSEKSPSLKAPPVQTEPPQEASTLKSESGLKSFSTGLLEAIVEGVDPKPATSKKRTAANVVDGKVPTNVLDAVNEGKLSALTVTKLRRMLSECGLKTAGRKSELIARLTSFVRK